VLVVGMHRSGTSAVASALQSLGLDLPRHDDLLGRRYGNEYGHFESLVLLEEGDDLLRRLGGSWDNPPADADPARPDELAPLVARARATFATAFPDRTRPVCWKDPRATLLLPFWRQAIDRPLAAVVSLRHPLEVAQSLERRDAVALPMALALWECYTRRCLDGLRGLPVFVSEYSSALADQEIWRAQMTEWLVALGVVIAGGKSSMARSPLFDPSLRHFRTDEGAGGPGSAGVVLQQQIDLFDEVLGLRGPHANFGPTASSTESDWTTYVLEQRRDAARMWKGMEWLSQELAGHFLTLPPAEPGEFVSVIELAKDATEDEGRYHEWLEARGESPHNRRVATADLLAVERARGLSAKADRHTGRRARRAHSWRLGSPQAERPPSSSIAVAEPDRQRRPLFSVIVPCYRPALATFDRCIASVLEQTHDDWEICLCDDASGDPALAEQLAVLAAADPRIHVKVRASNGGISAATNDALALASGRYVVFLDHDDELHHRALERIAQTIEEHPEADVIYSDEDKIDDFGRRFMPTFKPDWSPDLLLSNAYMCHVLVLRRELVTQLGGCRSEFDGAQDYDLMLRITEITSAIVHIPEVLYHWRTSAGSASGDPGAKPWAFEAGRRALEETARRRRIDASVVQHPRVPGSYHFMRTPKSGYLVSAIIPFRDEPALTAACYRSFIEHPGYDNFELLLVDNDSAQPETRALLEDLARDHRVRLIEAPGPFDWVAINNEAARKARGDLLLFLNNDVVARSHGWLAAMVAQAERPEVGAVGARLLYPDGTVQHAGVVVGVGWGATHVQQGISGDKPGYLSLTTVTRNFSAVTGACLMTRRSVFEEAGGFDGNLPIAFNDIDYCLRLRQAGLLVIYTPVAEMIHHESKSRGHSDDVTEAPFFRKRWRSLILSGDPYYNRNLGRFDNSCRLPIKEDEERWEIFLSMLGESSTS
jgi:GT2 family glycosyltransferase